MRSLLKTLGLPILLQPFRGLVTWACQRGFLSSEVRRLLPWSWVLEPFKIYGRGWKCTWSPTEFDTIGHEVFWSGLRKWEKQTASVILENVVSCSCFIDVGANCGIYTVLGCTVNPNLCVIAVEPVPKICRALERNVRQNNFDSRVTILNLALSDSNGMAHFHESEDATMGSLAVGGYAGQRGRLIPVESRTLDSVVEELKIEPDFVKIDVEGFAHLVLGGASQVLNTYRPRIVLEANPCDTGISIVNRILLKHGYEFHNITEVGLERLSAITPNEAHHDWLCIPSIPLGSI